MSLDVSYTPPGPVAQAFLMDEGFVTGLRGPVGSGKSVTSCIKIMRLSMQQKPGPDGIRHSRWAVVRNTQPELRTTTIKTWLDWFPEASWGRFNWSPPFTHRIRVGDLDIEVIFLALDTEDDVRKLKSLELTGAWVNEAQFVPKGIVDTLTERVGRYPSVRNGGCTWAGVIMDTNAMDPDHWWPIMAGEVPMPEDLPPEDLLMLVKPDNWTFYNQPEAMLDVKKDGELVGYEINPAAENLTALRPDYYPNQIRGKKRAEIQRYVQNRLIIVREGKAVWPSFVPEVHQKACAWQRDLEVLVGMDFGLTPAAVIAQRVLGQLRVFGELVAYGDMGARKFGRELKAHLAKLCPGLDLKRVRIYGDPAGDQRSQADDEMTPFLMIREAGFVAIPARTNDFGVRVDAVDGMLSRLVEGRPGMIVDPSCRHLLKALAGGYHYPQVKVAGTVRHADRPAKNMSSHVADAMQYLALGAGEGRADPDAPRAKVRTVDRDGGPFARRAGALTRSHRYGV